MSSFTDTLTSGNAPSKAPIQTEQSSSSSHSAKDIFEWLSFSGQVQENLDLIRQHTQTNRTPRSFNLTHLADGFQSYIKRALTHARFETLEDGSYYGEIDGIEGVYANTQTLQSAQTELQSVLEDWVILRLERGMSLPSILPQK